jgi:hypothetical protein
MLDFKNSTNFFWNPNNLDEYFLFEMFWMFYNTRKYPIDNQ